MSVLVCYAIQLYLLVIFVRLIMSWFPPEPGTTYNSIYDGFVTVTEPVLAPVRQLLPPFRMGATALDVSPILVFIGGQILARIIC
jgi:YggT family protein